MGKFILGFAIGLAAGAAYVVLTAPKPGAETRSVVNVSFRSAIEAGRQAAAAREQELWAKFRATNVRPTPAGDLPPLNLGY